MCVQMMKLAQSHLVGSGIVAQCAVPGSMCFRDFVLTLPLLCTYCSCASTLQTALSCFALLCVPVFSVVLHDMINRK